MKFHQGPGNNGVSSCESIFHGYPRAHQGEKHHPIGFVPIYVWRISESAWGSWMHVLQTNLWNQIADSLGSELQLLNNRLYQLNISCNIYMICFPARALQQNLHKQREERFLPIFQSHEYLAFKKAEGTPSWLLQPWQPRCENIWELSTLSQEHLSASCLWHVVAIQCPTSKVAEFSELMFDPVVVFTCLALVMLFLAASLLCAQHSVHHEFTKCFSFQLVMPWEKLRLNHYLPEALTSNYLLLRWIKKNISGSFPSFIFWKQNIYSISINFIHI